MSIHINAEKGELLKRFYYQEIHFVQNTLRKHF